MFPNLHLLVINVFEHPSILSEWLEDLDIRLMRCRSYSALSPMLGLTRNANSRLCLKPLARNPPYTPSHCGRKTYDAADSILDPL